MKAEDIVIIGIGDAGGRIVECLLPLVSGSRLAAINTDSDALSSSSIPKKILIGEAQTRGLGTGGDPVKGRRAIDDDHAALHGLFEDIKLAVVVAGLGGGTGSGVAPFVLEMARDADVSTLALVTLPLAFEGAPRKSVALDALSAVHDIADVAIAVENDLLAESSNRAELKASLEVSDQAVAGSLQCVFQILTGKGYVRAGLADLKRLASGAGPGALGFGWGDGTRRVRESLASLFDNPLLEHGEAVKRAKSILLTVASGDDLRISEVDEIVSIVREKAAAQAQLCVGTVIDPALADRLDLSLISFDTGHPVVPRTSAGASSTPSSRRRPAKGKSKASRAQDKLRFDAAGKGRFKDVEPTLLDGEDLDIPTFIRRGIVLEK